MCRASDRLNAASEASAVMSRTAIASAGIASAAVALLAASPAHAAVTDVEVTTRTDVQGGAAFGGAGAYERLIGKVHFSVAVNDPHNRGIVDLERASNLHDGKVEFSADFMALRPKDPHRGNGTVLLEVPNRGNPGIVSIVDGGDALAAHDAGDGWLLRRGYTIVSIGWQWDAAGEHALKLYAPIATDHGKPITGLLRGDLMPYAVRADIPLGHLIVGNIGGREYPVAAPEDPRDTLSVRDSRDAQRQIIARSRWQFAHVVGGQLEPSDRFIHLEGGFQPGKLYEYVYVVKDPVIAGLGFAAVRDVAAYAKHDPKAVVHAERVIGEGISQNGRFLRDMLYEGFNQDEEGRRALDGVLAHVAGAGRGSFNYRFAQPSRDAEPTSSVDFPTDIFPFTGLPERDPFTGETGALLERASAGKVLPRIFFSNTSHEYWGRAASLIHTSADARADAPISPSVRIYYYTGLQHYTRAFPPARGEDDLLGQEPQSPLPIRYFWRAMIANMDAWVRGTAEPPPSRYPRIDAGTLVPLARLAFPAIPGVSRPQDVSTGYRLDFGPHWRETRILTMQPPKVEGRYQALVPQVDADGNEKSGVRLPEETVPLATYTGWNLRDPSIGNPTQRVPFQGSYLPFPKTAAERQASGDPRKSIAERYSSREEYLRRFGAALDELIRERYILPEDRAALRERGGEEWDYVMKGG